MKLQARVTEQIRSNLAAPLKLAEVSSLGRQSQDAQIKSGNYLGPGQELEE